MMNSGKCKEPVTKDYLWESFINKEDVVLKCSNLVKYFLKKMDNLCDLYGREELFSVGIMGLLKAYDTFDLDKRIKFSTYASCCIKNEILAYHRKNKKFTGVCSLDAVTEDQSDNLYNVLGILDSYESLFLQDMRRAIQDLSELERQALLFTVARETQASIAKRLRVSQSTAGRIIKRAQRNLKRIYYGQ